MIKSLSIIFLIALGCSTYGQQPKFVINGQAQGTSYGIQYYAPDSIVSKMEFDSILAVIDRSMSLYDNQSLISMFNRTETHVELDEHISTVLKRAFDIHRISEGVFDVTVMPLVGLWGFGTERIKALPQQQTIDSTLQFVGMDKLILEERVLKKKDSRLKIDLNGIAQGYSVDVLCDFLDDRGIGNYLVELGGEIKVKGYKGDKRAFEVGIERPSASEDSTLILQLTDRAVTTSGNYRRAFNFEGKRIHHHIDPRNGYPVQNSVASVTVIAPTAMDADAYDNVFVALPVTESLALANKLDDIEIYLVYKEGEQFKTAFSDGFSRYIKHN